MTSNYLLEITPFCSPIFLLSWRHLPHDLGPHIGSNVPESSVLGRLPARPRHSEAVADGICKLLCLRPSKKFVVVK